MLNNFFNSEGTNLNRFWEWFQVDEKQKQEIQELVQSILQNIFLSKIVEPYGQEKVKETIKLLDRDNQGNLEMIAASFAALELGYYDLIDEIIKQLSINELISLQQFLEKE